MRFPATLLLVLLASSGGLLGEEVAAVPAPDGSVSSKSGYGTDDLQVVIVPFTRFHAWTGAVNFTSVVSSTLGGMRYLNSGTPVLAAEIDAGLIPNGAELESVTFFVRDTDAGADREFEGRLCRSWTDLDGTDPDADCPLTIQTTGAPGDATISADPNLAVRYQYDVDGDLEDEAVSYLLFARFGVGDEDVYGSMMGIRQVRLLFRRRVSPPPPLATFGDVPVGHPFFQFVEALAASGITAGCGSGVYCPDAPLTRGQMAVFLAKALGLHWPGPASP